MSDDTETKETQGEVAEETAETEAAEAVAEAEPEAAADEAEAAAAPEASAEEPPADEPVAEEPAVEEPAAEESSSAEAAPEEAAPEEVVDKPAADAPKVTYHDLHEMNVAELREVAAKVDHEAVHGYSTMHKEHLVPAICTALGIEAHEHHEVVGIDKEGVKAKIRELKKERDEAEAAGNKAKLKLARRRIRGLKRKIRKATV